MIKKNIYIMYTIVFLQGMVFYSPISTIFRQNRGLSIEQIFLLQALVSLIIVIFEVPLGYIGDKIGYKKMLTISNIVLFISKIVFYNSNSFQLFLLESILFGVSVAATSGCDVALLYESKGNENDEKIFGRYNAIAESGFLLSSLIAIYLINISFNLTAFATIIPHGICVILTLFLKDVRVDCTPKYEKEEKNSIKGVFNSLFTDRGIYLFIFIVFISLISQIVSSITVFLSQVGYVNLGIDFKFYGAISVCIQITGILSSQTYKIINKLGKKYTLILLLIPINISIFILIFTNHYILTILCMMIISGCFAMSTPIIISIQNNSIENENRATLLSVYSLIGNIMGSLINILIGRSADLSLKTAFFISLIIVIVSTIGIVFYLYKQYEYGNKSNEFQID